MRLNKSQQELVLEWIAEGIRSDEMNRRAAKCGEPFKITRQQVEYYRRSRGKSIQEITKRREFIALNTGLAVRSERVQALKTLAEKVGTPLLGSGFMFNMSEIQAFRGLLDDIAKEMGERSVKADVATDGEYIITFASQHPGKEDHGS